MSASDASDFAHDCKPSPQQLFMQSDLTRDCEPSPAFHTRNLISAMFLNWLGKRDGALAVTYCPFPAQDNDSTE